MSTKAVGLIKRAIRVYLEEDGATPGGAYRDAITDVLKLFYETINPPDVIEAYLICDEAMLVVDEEREIAESERLEKIPDKDLPLHVDDPWEYESTRKEIFRRLMTGPMPQSNIGWGKVENE
jgi:hypothetical protein